MQVKIAHLLLALLLLNTFLHPIVAEENSPEQVARVDALIAQMTLEQKVGQMFMVNIYGKALGDRGREFISTYQPGAVAIFGYNTDFEPASGIATLINDMQGVATTSGVGIPMIIAVDQEGGRVRRIVNDVTWFPEPLALGATTEPESVERWGAAAGRELKAIGVNMNLAPVADLAVRGDLLNQYRVMHRRTFGDDPERVGWQVAAYSDGLAQSGVIGVLKHYPGHGGAADSHAGLPRIETDAATARATALRAFEVAVANGVPAIMVGHLYYASLEPETDLPATISPTMIGLLRDELGFEGMIMTDAMDMSGLANNFYVPDAALRFVQAGGDMFVAGPYMTWETQLESMQKIIDAVRNGELSEERIDASVRRILLLKAGYGLLDWSPVDPATVTAAIDVEASAEALTATYMEAATLVRDEASLLPLDPDDSIGIAYPTVYQEIFESCSALAPEAMYFGYTRFEPAGWEYGHVAKMGRDYDKVVVFIEDAILNPKQADLLRPVPPEKLIVVSLGLPYDIEVAEGASTVLALYGSFPPARVAACHVLFGEHSITGRLPVAVEGYPTGSGLDLIVD